MEEYTPQPEEEKVEELKRWFQDNLRIVISVLIVIVIAAGIYSYSKRTDSPIVADQSQTSDENSDEAIAGGSTEQGAATNKDDGQAATTSKDGGQALTTSKDGGQTVSPAAISQETESSFIETAVRGDGLTTLARKATADYLEKNPDSALTKEHKIYIEDYLRKAVKHEGRVYVGTSVEFSKDLIQQAIQQSKNLNERQLQNLQKYSARVTSLS